VPHRRRARPPLVQLAWIKNRYRANPQIELRKGDTVVDVGAHVGLFSIYVARAVGAAGRVLAVEPAPDTFACCTQNTRPAVATSGGKIEAGPIDVVNVACGDGSVDTLTLTVYNRWAQACAAGHLLVCQRCSCERSQHDRGVYGWTDASCIAPQKPACCVRTADEHPATRPTLRATLMNTVAASGRQEQLMSVRALNWNYPSLTIGHNQPGRFGRSARTLCVCDLALAFPVSYVRCMSCSISSV
jgi:hypothetical protein